MAIKATIVADSVQDGGRGVVEFDGLDFNPSHLPQAVQHLLMLRGLKEKLTDVGAGREDGEHAERGHALWAAMMAGGYELGRNKVTAKPLTVDEIAYGETLGPTNLTDVREAWAALTPAERRAVRKDPRFMIAAGQELIRRASTGE